MKSGLVTVPGKLSDDLAIKTLRSIFKQAQLNKYLEEGDNN
ncbi:MAG: type II toxin-antitoxin system HicA family toxin [Microcystis sp.]